MNQLTGIRDQILPLLEKLPPDEADRARASLDRMVKSYEILETKFNRGVRDRAAIHSLLKKTSEDLLAQYRTIFEYTGTAMIVVEQDGTISLANLKFGELTGVSPAEIEGKRHVTGFFADHEQGRIWHYHKSRRHGNTDVPDQYETVIRSRNKGFRDVAITVGLFSGTGQSIISFLDITEQKQVVADLNRHRSNREALLILYQIEEASLDVIGQTTVEKAVKLTGSSIGILSLVGDRTNLSDTCWTYGIDHEDVSSLMGDRIHQAISQVAPRIENRFEVPPGLISRYGDLAHVITVPVLEADRVVAVIGLAGCEIPYNESDETQLTLLISTMWHIIIRREQETAISLANKKLNLMNDITRHDILNAVTGILGCVDMALASSEDSERNALLAEIRNGISTIHGHILFTRDYQKLGVNAPQWSDVKILVSSASEHFRNSPVAILNDIDDMEIFSDPMLERVIYNLIDNALRYGERLTTIHFFRRPDDSRMTIICEDDGVGVPVEMKEKIFDRGVGKNTGLGLFLTREILGITGMTIRETGETGRGARFEITVPPGQFRL
jgi:PAS domain S-box-containing protein